MASDRRIYLDHNASAPLLDAARQALIRTLSIDGNPSAVHGEGRRLRSIVEDARREVAALVGADGDCVVFTSGATESAMTCLCPEWVIDGRIATLRNLAVCATDHASIVEGGRFPAGCLTRLAVDAGGQLRSDTFDEWLAHVCYASVHSPDRVPDAILALTIANGETGILTALAPFVERAKGAGILVVLDAVQAAGRLPLDIKTLGADALILSGHKIGAAKGIGAFVLGRPTCRPLPLLTGGGQETRRRSGTEAVPLIASFGAAASIALQGLSKGDAERLLAMRRRLEKRLLEAIPDTVLIGAEMPRLANTLAVAVFGMKAETAQIALDLQGFAVSSGSACSSGKVGPSHVLKAMAEGGLAIDAMNGAIRVSFGTETSSDDLDRFVAALASLAVRRRDNAGSRALA